MSDFASKFSALGGPKLETYLGDAGTYTPTGASGLSIAQAVFQKSPDVGDEKARATLLIQASLLPGVSSADRRGDRWQNTGQSDAWTVVDYEDQFDGFLILNLVMPRVTGS